MVFGLLLMASSVLEQEFKEQGDFPPVFWRDLGKLSLRFTVAEVMLHGKCTNKMFLLNC